MTLKSERNGFASKPIALVDETICAPLSLPCEQATVPTIVAIDEDEDDDLEEIPVEELPVPLEPVDDFEEDDFDDEFDDDFEEELDEEEDLDETVTEADLGCEDQSDKDGVGFDGE